MGEIPPMKSRLLTRFRLCVACCVALAFGSACGDTGNQTPSPTPTPSGFAWLDRSVISSDGGIIVEKVSYRASGLKVWAEIFRPENTTHRTLLLWNHGGFAGLAEGDRTICRRLAADWGFVVAASYYRGEGGSEGVIEACKGEVDDVEALLIALKQEPYVDPDKIGVLGASHGGCVTLSVATRRPEVRVAVDMAGPSDWAALYNWMADQVARGEPFCAQIGRTDCKKLHQDMMQQLRAGLGGTPAQVPNAYAERSPIQRLGSLSVPTLFLHGTDDVLVNLDQTCLKRTVLGNAGRAPGAWNIDSSLHEKPSGTACGGGFRSSSVFLGVLAETNALVIYEGQGHELKDTSRNHVIGVITAFLLPHLS
jgi:pimeloyl-ACP methyl ester carboxylesterase